MNTVQGKLLLPSLYLPPAELISLAASHQVHVEVENKWEKKCLFNRTSILGPNGVQTLTVPVHSTEGRAAALRDIRICYQQDWIRVHTGALVAAYNSSPFFVMFKDELLSVYADKPEFLIDLNQRLNTILIRRLTKRRMGSAPMDIPGSEPVTDFRKLNDLQSIRAHFYPSSPYTQVFSDRFPFTPFLSWVDWLSNTGGHSSQA